MQCDVGLKSSIDAAISSLPASLRVDSLVCNAGVLLNERTLTEEGLECTAATHLVYGSYYLTKRLLSSEAARLADDGKVVFLSSGGMYNTKFSWAGCLSLDPDRYSGNLSYAYAKRGQVLLAEELTKAQPEGGKRSFVSAHPGWVDTPAVDLAYGSGKRALQPMRDLWQGAEGIAWLLTAPAGEVESGGFYLDRGVQKKVSVHASCVRAPPPLLTLLCAAPEQAHGEHTGAGR